MVRLLLARLHHAPSEVDANLFWAVKFRYFRDVVPLCKEFDYCDPAGQPVHDDIHSAV